MTNLDVHMIHDFIQFLSLVAHRFTGQRTLNLVGTRRAFPTDPSLNDNAVPIDFRSIGLRALVLQLDSDSTRTVNKNAFSHSWSRQRAKRANTYSSPVLMNALIPDPRPVAFALAPRATVMAVKMADFPPMEPNFNIRAPEEKGR